MKTPSSIADRSRPALRAINDWLCSSVGQACLLAGVAVIYLLAYRSHPNLPGNNPSQPLGWLGWWDQSKYQNCAVELASGHLSANSYWYPLGYSLFAALFARSMPQHAFLIINLACVIGIAATFFRIASKLISPIEALLLILAFVFAYRELLSMTLVVPWNTIPPHFLSYALILLLAFDKITLRRAILAAVYLGLIYLCRPADALCLSLVPGFAILRLPSWRERIQIGLSMAVMVFAFGAIIFLTKFAVFHAWSTPYEAVVGRIGFFSFPLAEKSFLLLADGTPFFHQSDSALIGHFPWLLLVVPGMVLLVARNGLGGFGALASIAITYGIYFAFNDFWPSNVFTYFLIHYLVWTLPLLALLAYVGLREGWKTRLGRWSFVSVPLFLLPVWFVGLAEANSTVLNCETVDALEIPASASKPVAWIAFDQIDQVPVLQQGARVLVLHSDFVVSHGPAGIGILLGKAYRMNPTLVTKADLPNLHELRFGGLAWRGQWMPQSVAGPIERWLVKPKVRRLGRGAGIDVAGPTGEPDGVPDELIRIELPGTTLRKIISWEIEAKDQSAHWVSSPNPQHWWVIKTLPVEETGSPLRQAIRLCVPDYGQLDHASASMLRGMDWEGRVLIRATIRKQSVKIAR